MSSHEVNKLLFDANKACDRNQALALDATLASHITNLNRIISFRHRLIHGYAQISPEIVWGIAIDDVPILARELRSLLTGL